MNRVVIGGLLFCTNISFVFAQIQITEVMYDPSGTDSGREWVEVQNTSGATIDFTTWKFFEANVNHGIDQIDGYAKELAAGEFGVVVSDKVKFLTDFPSFTGKIFKSSFSLNNSGENLAFKTESSGPIIDQYLYDVTLGAAGDGNSLQKGTIWFAALPTPGAATASGSGGTSGGGGVGGGTGTTTATTTASTPPPTGGGGTGGGTGDMGTTSTSTIPASTPVVTGSGGGYVVPQLFGAVIAPSVAIAGVDTMLQAQAFVLGGKSVQNPRFAWNFGDGSIGQGASTTHRYKYPGKYHIALDVTATMNNNDTSVLEHASLTVIAPDVSISEGVDTDGLRYIHIENETKYILEVSSWIIQRGNTGSEQYVLPKNTFISPYTSIRIPEDVTKFKNDNVLRAIELLFPNRTLAARYDPIESLNVASTTTQVVPLLSVSSVKPYVATSLMTSKVASIVNLPEKIHVRATTSQQEIVAEIGMQEQTSTSSPISNNIVAAVTTSGASSTSFLWYIIPLLVLVITGGLFLGRQKEGNPLDGYTIIDDEK
jgi:hypothetical protein